MGLHPLQRRAGGIDAGDLGRAAGQRRDREAARVGITVQHALQAELRSRVRAGDQVVYMSNGGFEGAPQRFAATLGTS